MADSVPQTSRPAKGKTMAPNVERLSKGARPEWLYFPAEPFTTEEEDGGSVTWLTRPHDVARALELEGQGKLVRNFRAVLNHFGRLNVRVPDEDEVHLAHLFSWSQDEDTHRVLRAILEREFRVGNVSWLPPFVNRYVQVQTYAQKKSGLSHIDIAELARMASIYAMRRLMGIRPKLADRLDAAVASYTQLGLRESLDPEPQDVSECLAQIVAQNQKKNNGGVVGSLALAAAREDVTPRQRDAMIWGCWAVGRQAIASGIAMLFGLTAEFGYMAEAYEHTSISAKAVNWRLTMVDEALRFSAPVPLTRLVAQDDVTLSTWFTIPRGLVNVVWSAAGRLGEGDVFDPHRERTGRFAFGRGPHGCVAATFSRDIMEKVFGSVLRALPGLQLEEDGWEWESPSLTNGVKRAVFTYEV